MSESFIYKFVFRQGVFSKNYCTLRDNVKTYIKKRDKSIRKYQRGNAKKNLHKYRDKVNVALSRNDGARRQEAWQDNVTTRTNKSACRQGAWQENATISRAYSAGRQKAWQENVTTRRNKSACRQGAWQENATISRAYSAGRQKAWQENVTTRRNKSACRQGAWQDNVTISRTYSAGRQKAWQDNVTISRNCSKEHNKSRQYWIIFKLCTIFSTAPDTGHSPLSEGLDPPLVLVVILSLERKLKNGALACEQALLFGRVKRVSRERASEQASGEAARGLGPSLARSREAHFARPNRRACSQANRAPVNSLEQKATRGFVL